MMRETRFFRYEDITISNKLDVHFNLANHNTMGEKIKRR